MTMLTDAGLSALALIARLDPEVCAAAATSLTTSGLALLLAALLGVPAGAVLALGRFSGRRPLLILLDTLLALPTVVIGLVLFALLSRQGPFGVWGLLYTPAAMVAGQAVLALPIVIHFTCTAVAGADPRIYPTALTLGAAPLRAAVTVLDEVRRGVLAALVAAFGRVIGEVGVAMMLGGNIRGSTRTLTTAIALETSKGELAFGLALGLILLSLALGVNLTLALLTRRS